jgi:type IV secretion system protein TrbL
MNSTGVVDQFTNVFTTYIDSGFGLLRPEVAFLTGVLVVLDMTLAGLFWAMGGETDVIARLIRKTLYVGFFAFIIGNFNNLAKIIFNSFAGLGLQATGSTVTIAQFLQPGRLAHVGIDAGRPILQAVGQLMGFVSFFDNFVQIFILLIAWLVIIVAFFILAVQLFITIIEFKLTTLAGFVLAPFGLWGKSAFLAERVLGNVISTGVKVLILAVIVGIGTTLFGQFTAAFQNGQQPGLEDVLTIVLASLSLLGLGIFGPGIATGLVSGAPQLAAGAAVGTAAAAAGLGVAGGAAALGGGRAALAGIRAATSLASGAKTAYGLAAATSGETGLAAAAAGMGGAARAGMGAATQSARALGAKAAAGLRASADAGARGAWTASGGRPMAAFAEGEAPARAAPRWAERLRAQQLRAGKGIAHALREGERPGHGANPRLDLEER